MKTNVARVTFIMAIMLVYIGARAANDCGGLVDRGTPCSNQPPEFWTSDAYLWHIPGDANWSGEVEVQDFVAVLSSWGYECCWTQDFCCVDTDFCQDGSTDIGDFLMVLSNWGLESNQTDWLKAKDCWP